MRKRRLLMVNEFSLLSTGFAVYGKELLSRLHACDYEVAELATNCGVGDPRAEQVPWRVYPNVPAGDLTEFNSKGLNVFGAFSFNRVCLDFKPDVVIDIRDPWMYSFIEHSPFRRLFHWIQMPTVDSTPYKEEWLATLTTCDRVLAYTDWSREVLQQEGGGLINVVGTAPYGANFENFQAYDRREMRDHFNLEDDALIVGTVMRNQVRKLYPQLIKDFATFIREADKHMASKAYLYLHTAHPDLGYDIPWLIKQSGISHKILLTYKCRDCMAIFPSFYADSSMKCPRCKSMRCQMPNVSNGIDHSTLGKILATFDVYVQYSSNEGFGMPQIEAAACGVPIMSVDYSAMSDVVRKLGGHPIKVASLDFDSNTDAYRARPDGRDFVKALKRFFRMGDREMDGKRHDVRKAVERHYTWEQTVATWRSAIDSLPLRDWSETWNSPSLLQTPRPLADLKTIPEIVRWSIAHILCRPDLVNSYLALQTIRDLNWGTRSRIRGSHEPYSVETMVKEFRAVCDFMNHWETARGQCPKDA